MLFLVAIFLFVAGLDESASMTWTFNKDPVGVIAPGFSNESGQWTVEKALGERIVITQKAVNHHDVFHLALVEDVQAKDLILIAHVQTYESKNGLGGGLVWHAKDSKNYYLASYNPFQDRFRLDKFVDGVRIKLDEFDVVHKKRIFDLEVAMQRNRIECKLDGETLLEAEDRTFPDAGRIGLWTEPQGQAEFDDLVLKTTDH